MQSFALGKSIALQESRVVFYASFFSRLGNQNPVHHIAQQSLETLLLIHLADEICQLPLGHRQVFIGNGNAINGSDRAIGQLLRLGARGQPKQAGEKKTKNRSEIKIRQHNYGFFPKAICDGAILAGAGTRNKCF